MTQPTPEALLTLAESCEQANGPDRRLDADIAATLHGVDAHAYLGLSAYEHLVPRLTSSLDAAMSLTEGASPAEQFSILHEALTRCPRTDGKFGKALPRYVTAASLRALASQVKTGGQG